MVGGDLHARDLPAAVLSTSAKLAVSFWPLADVM
jgi:hypothetical protein